MSLGAFFFSSQCCFFSSFLSEYALEADDFFFNDRRENEQGNEVWNCHECVGNIGEVPYQIQGLGSTYVNNQGEYNSVNHIEFMGSEEVFPCFFAVVFPAKDGGEGEEDDTDSYDVGSDDADVGREGCHGEGNAFQRSTAGISGAKDTGGSNGKTGNAADNDGIPEGAGHIDVALTNRIIGGGSSSGNSCRAQAGFIGEAASGNAVTHGVHNGDGNGAEDAAADSLRIEGHHEDQIEAVRYVLDINKNADNACDDVEHSHTGNNDRGNFGNCLDTAYDDDERQDGQNHAADFQRNAEDCLHSSGNGVCLGHVADTERSDDREECEEETEGAAGHFMFEAVFHGEHGAALHFTFGIHFTVFNSQHAFGEFGGEAEACGNPHPYQGAGAAGEHGGGNAYDIAGADGGSQGSH